MRFFCIGDEDTVRGFALAGVDGEAVATPEQAAVALGRAVARAELGVVVITDRVAAGIRRQVEAHRLTRERPILVEIPGPGGVLPGRKSLRELVQEAVGMRLG